MNSWHTISTGLLIGALVAVAASSLIALFQFSSGAPWKDLLDWWGKMLVMTVPAFASATAAAMLAWQERRNLPKAPAVVIAPAISSVEQMSLSEAVVQNARDQAWTYYQEGGVPTRRAFEKAGVSQRSWNSGRHILTTAKIIEGNTWSPKPWAVIEATLDGIHAEPDRVWVRPLGERGMICLHISEGATGNRHTQERPTPPPPESEM